MKGNAEDRILMVEMKDEKMHEIKTQWTSIKVSSCVSNLFCITKPPRAGSQVLSRRDSNGTAK